MSKPVHSRSTNQSASKPQAIGTCDNCGLCCEHLLVMPNAIDVLREPRIETERPLGTLSLSVLEASWLLAGPGRPCPFLTLQKQCSIYPTRPNVCVTFMPGSIQCRELRSQHGLVPVALKPLTVKILTDIMKEAIDTDAKLVEES